MRYDEIVHLIPASSRNTAQQDVDFAYRVLGTAVKEYEPLTISQLARTFPAAHDLSPQDMANMMKLVRHVEGSVLGQIEWRGRETQGRDAPLP